MPKLVEVVAHDLNWILHFEDEAALLGSVLKETASAIHHIGSTSVAGLPAKPVIDILIEVSSVAELAARGKTPTRSVDKK